MWTSHVMNAHEQVRVHASSPDHTPQQSSLIVLKLEGNIDGVS